MEVGSSAKPAGYGIQFWYQTTLCSVIMLLDGLSSLPISRRIFQLHTHVIIISHIAELCTSMCYFVEKKEIQSSAKREMTKNTICYIWHMYS